MRFRYRLASLMVAFLLGFASIASAEPSQNIIDTMKRLIETSVDDYYYHKVECNESGVIVQIAFEGLSFGMMSISEGLSDSELWERSKASCIEYANSLLTLIKISGIVQPNLLFMLVDDLNMETTFLAIYNGTVIYDCLPGK